MRDRLDLQRIGHNHAGHIRRKHADDGHCVASSLNDDFVLLAKATAETPPAPSGSCSRAPPDATSHPPRTPPPQTFDECPCQSHVASSAPLLRLLGSSGQHDNYGSALAAQPGRSQGRPATNASSRLMMRIGLPTSVLPVPLVPDGRTIRRNQADPSRTGGHRDPHTGYQSARAAVRRGAPAHQSHPACLWRTCRLEADVCRAHSCGRALARDQDHRIRATSAEGNPRRDRQGLRRAQCPSNEHDGYRSPNPFIQQRADLTPAPDNEWIFVGSRVRAFPTRKHLLVSNSGPDGEGYDYCTGCGRIEAVVDPEVNLSQPHTRPHPSD